MCFASLCIVRSSSDFFLSWSISLLSHRLRQLSILSALTTVPILRIYFGWIFHDVTSCVMMCVSVMFLNRAMYFRFLIYPFIPTFMLLQLIYIFSFLDMRFLVFMLSQLLHSLLCNRVIPICYIIAAFILFFFTYQRDSILLCSRNLRNHFLLINTFFIYCAITDFTLIYMYSILSC